MTALKIVVKRRKEKFLTEAGKDDDVMKLLFINACARERGISRTLELCDTFIEAFCEKHPETVVEELNLFRSGIKQNTAMSWSDRGVFPMKCSTQRMILPRQTSFWWALRARICLSRRY